MRIDQIKHFIKTVDTLNITRAAEELYITQSVLSKQIAGMERELNVVLFHRSSTGIKLTPVGVVAYERFSKVLQAYESAILHIREHYEHVDGTLSFAKLSGLKPSASLTDALADFSRLYPGITILRKNQNNGPMTESLRNGKYDIYLTWKQDVDDNSEIEYISLAKFRVSLAISAVHPLAFLENPTIDLFRDVRWITIQETESYKLNRIIAKVINNAGFEPSIIHADNLGDMIDLINDGVGVGIVSEGHILHGTASMRFINFDEIPSWTMVIACRKDNKNPLTREFLSLLKKRIEEAGSSS
jgi:DNA-binding transcriptional LysR family regulator